MKKMLFLMLFLLSLGAATVSSQVRIGGNGQPNGAAVLDLNATDGITGTKGLALPRVTLSSTTAQLTSGVSNLNGMLVYNTGGSLGAGIYYWNGSLWQAIMNGALVEADGIVGNEITDTIANGGLTRAGAGTAASPYKVGIKTAGIQTGMIADKAVTLNKIFTQKSDSGLTMISNGTSWTAAKIVRPTMHWPDSLHLLTNPRPVTSWKLLLDTNIVVAVSGEKTYIFDVPGMSQYAMCIDSGSDWYWVIKGTSDDILIAHWLSNSINRNVNLRVRCFLPSF